MMNGLLSSQIKPNLVSTPDPDQTFRQYVEELMGNRGPDKPPAGFGGPFSGGQSSQQQQSTPQTSITDGLFSKYINDGGGEGVSGSSGTSSGQGISTAAQNVGFGMMANPSVAGQIGSIGLGLLGIQAPPSIVMTQIANAIGKGIIDNQINAISNSFGAMNSIGSMGLGGVGTISDVNGNISSISTPGMIDAYDLATFGTTGDGLSSGFGFGGVSASDMGNLGFGGGSLGGFATDGGGAGGSDSGGGVGPGGDTGQGPSGVGPSW